MKMIEKRKLNFNGEIISRMIYHHGYLGEVCKIKNVLFHVKDNEVGKPILYEKFFYPSHEPRKEDLQKLGLV